MIILFHILNIMASDILHAVLSLLPTDNKKCTREKIIAAGRAIKTKDGYRFSPPVYVQRYQAVSLILEDPRWCFDIKKVVDFGCSELHFFPYVKNLSGVKHFLAIDIDRDTLDLYKARAAPILHDYVKCRLEPLNVQVIVGSVACQDPCLLETDAVVCIELIEHLYADVLEDLPYTIFGYMQPKIAIFTTPNVEFNKHFNLEKDCFRHDDHKFEWSRPEFTKWANDVAAQYPAYEVSFAGIGPGTEETEQEGCVSQMAIFVRRLHVPVNKSPQVLKEGKYEVLETYEFPVRVDPRSDDEKALHEAEYHIKYFKYPLDDCYEKVEIPLSRLMPFVKEWCTSITKFRDILTKGDWKVIDNKDGEMVVLYPQSSDDSSSSLGDNDLDPINDNDFVQRQERSDSDWDNDIDIVAQSKSEVNYSNSPVGEINLEENCNTIFLDPVPLVVPHSEKDLFSHTADLTKKEELPMDSSLPEDLSFLESFSSDGQKEKDVDSGYPNSVSAQDINVDLTFEQLEEMLTENDDFCSESSSLDEDSSSDSGDENHLDNAGVLPPVVHAVENEIRVIDVEVNHVENGDVANNNRDGEGNNAIAIPPEDVIIGMDFDRMPLVEEDFHNDNNIALPDNADPFPHWLLQLLDVAHHEAGDLQGFLDVVAERAIDRHGDGSSGSSGSESEHESDEDRLLVRNNLGRGEPHRFNM